MADYGIKVMRDGYDVSTVPNSAANILKFALLTSVSLLKIKQVGRVNIAASGTTNIAHGLAYKPLFWAFYKNGSDILPCYHWQQDYGIAYIDSTNLVLKNNGFSSYDFYYYIFYDSV